MLGARVIEKHFTLNHAWKGTDHAFSLMPDGMRQLRPRPAPRPVRARRRREAPARRRGARRFEKMGKKLVATRDARRRVTSSAADDLASRSRRRTAACRPTSSSDSLGRRAARRARRSEQRARRPRADVETGRGARSAALRERADGRWLDGAASSSSTSTASSPTTASGTNERGEESVACFSRATGRACRRLDEVGVDYLDPHLERQNRRRARAARGSSESSASTGVEDKLPVLHERSSGAACRARGHGVRRQRHQRRRVPRARSGSPSSRPTRGPRSCRSRSSCSRARAAHGCVREFCDAVWNAKRAATRDLIRSSTSTAASPS